MFAASRRSHRSLALVDRINSTTSTTHYLIVSLHIHTYIDEYLYLVIFNERREGGLY